MTKWKNCISILENYKKIKIDLVASLKNFDENEKAEKVGKKEIKDFIDKKILTLHDVAYLICQSDLSSPIFKKILIHLVKDYNLNISLNISQSDKFGIVPWKELRGEWPKTLWMMAASSRDSASDRLEDILEIFKPQISESNVEDAIKGLTKKCQSETDNNSPQKKRWSKCISLLKEYRAITIDFVNSFEKMNTFKYKYAFEQEEVKTKIEEFINKKILTPYDVAYLIFQSTLSISIIKEILLYLKKYSLDFSIENPEMKFGIASWEGPNTLWMMAASCNYMPEERLKEILEKYKPKDFKT